MATGLITTYGLLLGGQVGAQQEQRRAELLSKGKFSDVTVRALTWPPLCPAGRRGMGSAFDPGEEPYSEVLDAALDLVASSGVAVFTGIGGDELMSLRSSEQESRRAADPAPTNTRWIFLTRKIQEMLEDAMAHRTDAAPTPVVAPESLLAHASRAPVFLRNRCWPISPLCTPELIRFCEWLPVQWRRNRRLQRAHLQRMGMSRDWVYPQLRENFVGVMQAGLRRYGLALLATLMSDSLLAEFGFIDAAAVTRYVESHKERSVEPIEDSLYDVAVLELGLRRLLGHPYPRVSVIDQVHPSN